MLKKILTFIFFLYVINIFGQSIFAEGNWYKLEIKQRGIYKIDYNYLKSSNIPVDDINPKKIKIYGYEAGMLPQQIDNNLSYEPKELSIEIRGEEDEQFDESDYILFYAEDAHQYKYNRNDTLAYNYNIYDNTNYYFLRIDANSDGLRIEKNQNIDVESPIFNEFDDFIYFEEEKYNILNSGREWYSRRYDDITSDKFSFDIENVVSNSNLKITFSMMAQSFSESSFDFKVNSKNIGTMTIDPINDFNIKVFQYDTKGVNAVKTYNTIIEKTDNIEIELNYTKNNPSYSIGYLNNFLLEVKRTLSLFDNQMIWRVLESTNHPYSKFQISNANEMTRVWNITVPLTPINQETTLDKSNIFFGAETESLQEYIVFSEQLNNVPLSLNQIENQNILSLTGISLLIISHKEFISEAKRLAKFRTENDGLLSEAIIIDEVYNEFSGGRQDITAIRNLAKYLYDNGNLEYLLLMGRGSFDYKNTRPNNKNFIPIYESRNSLHPLKTYASDDYFGFLEDNEGYWDEETNQGGHSLDIGIGRIPITRLEEAKQVVDKILNYADSKTLGIWRNNLLFVADDGDDNLHQAQADQLATEIEKNYASFFPIKFYLDDFEQQKTISGEVSPMATEALNNMIENGILIVNFTGHGGEIGWMDERVLGNVEIQNWKNLDRLPLFVTATCEFGRHDNPSIISAGERILTSKNGGGIAIVSTCRPVLSSNNYQLNKVFYEEVFKKNQGEYSRLGDIFRMTKNNVNANKVGNRNFALLGDPSLKLNYPENNIVITKLNNKNKNEETLKALSKALIEGEIRNPNGQIINDFNGDIFFTFYDKDIIKNTLGGLNNEIFSYKSKENIIFRGSSTVVNGIFKISFIVPKNISYTVGNSYVNMYAFDDTRDANGTENTIKIGESSTNSTENDITGPEIRLYIGDSTFADYQNVSHNTNLLIRLYDENGINLSSFNSDKNITATLNDKTFLLNDFFYADKDSYQKGQINFPLNNLEKGKYTLLVKVFDVYNNFSEQYIEFEVADPNIIFISDASNYPNPFNHTTTFELTHNRVGDNLIIDLEIISPVLGNIIKQTIKINNSPSRIPFFEWDGHYPNGSVTTSGVYLYKISVTSERDRAKNHIFKKLIYK